MHLEFLRNIKFKGIYGRVLVSNFTLSWENQCMFNEVSVLDN